MTLDPNTHINAARHEIDKLRVFLSKGDAVPTRGDLEHIAMKIDQHLSMAQAIIADQKVYNV